MNEREKHGYQKTSKQRPAVLVRLYDTVRTLYEHILSSAQDASGLQGDLLRPDDDIEYAQVLLDTYVCAVGCNALPKLTLPAWPQESSCSMVEVSKPEQLLCETLQSYIEIYGPLGSSTRPPSSTGTLSSPNTPTPARQTTHFIHPLPLFLRAEAQHTPSISEST